MSVSVFLCDWIFAQHLRSLRKPTWKLCVQEKRHATLGHCGHLAAAWDVRATSLCEELLLPASRLGASSVQAGPQPPRASPDFGQKELENQVTTWAHASFNHKSDWLPILHNVTSFFEVSGLNCKYVSSPEKGYFKQSAYGGSKGFGYFTEKDAASQPLSTQPWHPCTGGQARSRCCSSESIHSRRTGGSSPAVRRCPWTASWCFRGSSAGREDTLDTEADTWKSEALPSLRETLVNICTPLHEKRKLLTIKWRDVHLVSQHSRQSWPLSLSLTGISKETPWFPLEV